jgi:putative endonuclease
MWSVYIIRCCDDSLYTGISTDVAKRMSVHQSCSLKASKYVRSRYPIQLVYQAEIGSKSEASRAEVLIKKLSKRQKEALVAGTSSLAELGIVNPQPH